MHTKRLNLYSNLPFRCSANVCHELSFDRRQSARENRGRAPFPAISEQIDFPGEQTMKSTILICEFINSILLIAVRVISPSAEGGGSEGAQRASNAGRN